MDFAHYQSLSQINMASLENTSDCYLESLAREAKKNDMAFLVGFYFLRGEKPCIDDCKNIDVMRTTQHKLVCIHVAVYKCCYICVQVSILGAFSISGQIHNQENRGQTSGDCPIYRKNLEWSAKNRNHRSSGIFPTYEKLLWVHFTHDLISHHTAEQ